MTAKMGGGVCPTGVVVRILGLIECVYPFLVYARLLHHHHQHHLPRGGLVSLWCMGPSR